MTGGKIAKAAVKVAKSKKFLFGLGIVGVGLTVTTAVTGTLIAKKHVDEKKEEIKQEVADQAKIPVEKVDEVKLTKVELLQTTWKDYVPTACSVAVTIVSFSRLFGVMKKENLALQSMVTMTEATVQRLEKKMVDELGEKKAQKQIKEVHQDVLKDQGVNEVEVPTKYLDTHGDEFLRICDPYTRRKFKATKLQIQKAMEDVNLELHDNGEATMNTFYTGLYLDESEVGDLIGWRLDSINDGKIEVELTGPMVEAYVDEEGVAWTIPYFSIPAGLILP